VATSASKEKRATKQTYPVVVATQAELDNELRTGTAKVVEIGSPSDVTIYLENYSGAAHFIAYDQASVIAYGNASVTAPDLANVVAFDSATVILHDKARTQPALRCLSMW